MTDENRTIGPTPERLRMAGENVEVYTPDKNQHWRAIRLMDNAVLELLYTREVINLDEYCAGAKFYLDWYQSGLTDNGVVDPGRVIVDGGRAEYMTDHRLAALQSWRRAIQAVGLIHSTVLTDVVLHGHKLEAYGRKFFGKKNDADNRDAARIALVLALRQLDLHYHGQRRNRTRSGHLPDYRPYIVMTEEE